MLIQNHTELETLVKRTKRELLTNLVITDQQENDNTLMPIVERRAKDILLRYNKKKKENCSEGSIKGSCELLKSSVIKRN